MGPSISAGQDSHGGARALDLFMEAEEAYEAGEIERAVELLREARRLRREPVLLYNLARAYDTLGRLDEALEAYQGFLEEDPEAPDRGAIETRMAALQRQIEERERLEEERAARAAPDPPAVSEPSPFPWVILGAGVVTLGSAIVFGLLSTEARDEAVRDPFYATAAASLARAQDFALAANGLFALGGALCLAGAIWGTVDLVSMSVVSEPQIAIGMRPDGVVLRGRW